MDWQTSVTYVFLAAAGGIVLKRLAAFARSGRTGSCGACSGCSDSATDKVPLHLVQLATSPDLNVGNPPVPANREELHPDFSSNVSAEAEKNG